MLRCLSRTFQLSGLRRAPMSCPWNMDISESGEKDAWYVGHSDLDIGTVSSLVIARFAWTTKFAYLDGFLCDFWRAGGRATSLTISFLMVNTNNFSLSVSLSLHDTRHNSTWLPAKMVEGKKRVFVCPTAQNVGHVISSHRNDEMTKKRPKASLRLLFFLLHASVTLRVARTSTATSGSFFYVVCAAGAAAWAFRNRLLEKRNFTAGLGGKNPKPQPIHSLRFVLLCVSLCFCLRCRILTTHSLFSN